MGLRDTIDALFILFGRDENRPIKDISECCCCCFLLKYFVIILLWDNFFRGGGETFSRPDCQFAHSFLFSLFLIFSEGECE
jgi:hypothetical protein